MVYEPDGSSAFVVAPAPEDMAPWLRSNPRLNTGKPKPASVGGEKGTQFTRPATEAV